MSDKYVNTLASSDDYILLANRYKEVKEASGYQVPVFEKLADFNIPNSGLEYLCYDGNIYFKKPEYDDMYYHILCRYNLSGTLLSETILDMESCYDCEMFAVYYSRTEFNIFLILQPDDWSANRVIKIYDKSGSELARISGLCTTILYSKEHFYVWYTEVTRTIKKYLIADGSLISSATGLGYSGDMSTDFVDSDYRYHIGIVGDYFKLRKKSVWSPNDSWTIIDLKVDGHDFLKSGKDVNYANLSYSRVDSKYYFLQNITFSSLAITNATRPTYPKEIYQFGLDGASVEKYTDSYSEYFTDQQTNLYRYSDLAIVKDELNIQVWKTTFSSEYAYRLADGSYMHLDYPIGNSAHADLSEINSLANTVMYSKSIDYLWLYIAGLLLGYHTCTIDVTDEYGLPKALCKYSSIEDVADLDMSDYPNYGWSRCLSDYLRTRIESWQIGRLDVCLNFLEGSNVLFYQNIGDIHYA